jgi:hypothetical protein
MSGLSFGAVTAPTAQPTIASVTAKPRSAADDFLAYMKESPAQRMEDSWLAAHGLSKEALAAMPPDKRAAVLKQMANDIKNQVTQAAQDKAQQKPTAAA